MTKGIFITLEGPEGGGKTTQRGFVHDYFVKQGREVVTTREPGGTVIAEQVRSILITPNEDEALHSPTELLLMFACRAQHTLEVIIPALQRGAVVICDRYYDSSYAYQVHGRGLDRSHLDALMVVANVVEPDLTLYLRVDPKVGASRALRRGFDRFDDESSAFMARVLQGFDDQAARYPDRFILVEAGEALHEVTRVVLGHVDNFYRGFDGAF